MCKSSLDSLISLFTRVFSRCRYVEYQITSSIGLVTLLFLIIPSHTTLFYHPHPHFKLDTVFAEFFLCKSKVLILL